MHQEGLPAPERLRVGVASGQFFVLSVGTLKSEGRRRSELGAEGGVPMASVHPERWCDSGRE